MNENKHVWTVILAAGASRRFNGIKALMPWEGGTLLSKTIATAQEFSGGNVIVVTGAHKPEIEPALGQVKSVFNADWEKGMGASLAAGVREVQRLDDAAEIILVLPVDQPHVHAGHLHKLLEKSKESGLCTLSTDGKVDTPPAAITREFFKDALALSGDRGIKASLTKYNVVIDPKVTQDVDTRLE